MRLVRTLLLAAALLGLVAAGAALPGDAAWTTFTDPIDRCKPDSACTTADTMGTLQVSRDGTVRIHADTGMTGFCGTAGARTSVTVPRNASTLQVRARASKAAWGQGPGIMINDTFVHRFTRDNPDAHRWPWQNVTVNVSRYRGERIQVRVVVQDTSREWCNMADHPASITVDGVRFSASRDVRPFPTTVAPAAPDDPADRPSGSDRIDDTVVDGPASPDDPDRTDTLKEDILRHALSGIAVFVGLILP